MFVKSGSSVSPFSVTQNVKSCWPCYPGSITMHSAHIVNCQVWLIVFEVPDPLEGSHDPGLGHDLAFMNP
jgi:hypothetical protein